MPLTKAKAQFMEKLAKHGLEDNIVVANVRKSKKNRVGYYSSMSQFRSKPRIVVDVPSIESHYEGSRMLVEEEILLTIAHEYGHVMAECIRELPRVSNGREAFKGLPDWKEEFDEDEEQFAEDFARFLVTYDALSESFWDQFMPLYAAEFKRIFICTEGRHDS